LLAGVLTPLAFAPFDLSPLAWLAPVLLFRLWLDADRRRAFSSGWWFGVGLLGTGVSWVQVSIDQFGNVGFFLAALITLAFVLGVAVFYGFAGWLCARLRGSGNGWVLLFPAVWVLSEWLKGWVLTGFPWLSLGYSQLGWPLAGYAPLLGVYGVSLVVVGTSAGLLMAWRESGAPRIAALGAVAVVWCLGAVLAQQQWTRPTGEPFVVSIVQGNVAQELKWRPEKLLPTLETYLEMTREHWGSDLIIWPETAVPALYHQVERSFLAPLDEEAGEHGALLLLGIPFFEKETREFFNSMVVLGGEPRSRYDKRHLVPFGEFLPLETLLRPVLDWLVIPMSNFTPGSSRRPSISIGPYLASISICYEDAFGEEVIQALPEAAFLVNASNDAWFGDSLAPHQHLQIARMRALETGRMMLRATNTGISAIIDEKGRLVEQAPAFERTVLSGTVQPMVGATPYVRIGNSGVLGLVLAGLLIGLVPSLKRRLAGAVKSSPRDPGRSR